jgi:hydroxyethylthiazole kinase-like uncharacterized protein yjeF
MKITTAAEMAAIDRSTSERHGVDSLTLMENAGAAVADFAREHWPGANRITVVCGKGNNGGDGLVAARRLHTAGKVVEVLLLGAADALKPDAAAMLERLPLRPVVLATTEAVVCNVGSALDGADLIIDAVFGTGFKPRGEVAGGGQMAECMISAINQASAPVLSVDLPSGWDADSLGAGEGQGAKGRAPVCRSNGIVTFTAPKPAHMCAPLTRGPVAMAGIGSPEEAIVSAQNLYAITPLEASALFRPRALDSNKGRFGHVLVVGGSAGKAGAAALCGLGALRAGAGLVTVATPAAVLGTVAGFAAELMTEALGEPGSGRLDAADASHCLELAKSRNVLAIGPGLSQRPGVAEFVHRVVRGARCPVVLDADGLTAFSGSREPLQSSGGPLILTPHPGEMARLIGKSVADVQGDRVGVARAFASRHRCILVLKGFRTLIAYPGGEVWISGAGNPGMATGGSGDVLTGMIAASVAQFPSRLEEAVRAAVWLHGLAGDAAAEHFGEEALVAGDLLHFLPLAFGRMREWARGKTIRLR